MDHSCRSSAESKGMIIRMGGGMFQRRHCIMYHVDDMQLFRNGHVDIYYPPPAGRDANAGQW